MECYRKEEQIPIYGVVGTTAITIPLLGVNAPKSFFQIQNIDSRYNIAYTFDGTTPVLSNNGTANGIGNLLLANGGCETCDTSIPDIQKLQLVGGGPNTAFVIRYTV